MPNQSFHKIEAEKTVASATPFNVDIPTTVNSSAWDNCAALVRLKILAYRPGVAAVTDYGIYAIAYERTNGTLTKIGETVLTAPSGANPFSVAFSAVGDRLMRIAITPGTADSTKFMVQATVSFSDNVAALPTANLLVWYDLTKQDQPKDAAIATLTDFSGNNYHANQSTTSKRPTFKRPALGLQNAYLNYAAAQCWQSGLFGAEAATTTVFTVFRHDGVNFGEVFDGTTGKRNVVYVKNKKLSIFAGNNELSAAADLVHGWHIVTAVFNGPTSYVRDNGTQVITAGPDALNPGTQPLNGVTIGAFTDQTNAPFGGAIGEIIVYNGVLDSTAIANVEKYLKRKWGRYFQYPFNLPALKGWWKAEHISSPSGALIPTWVDYSGFDNELSQSVVSRQLVLTKDAINGRAAVESDGSAKWMISTNPLSPNPTSQPITILATAKVKTRTLWRRLFTGSVANSPSLYLGTDFFWTQFAGAGVTQQASDTNWHRIVTYFSGASSNMWLDGVAGAAGNTDNYGFQSGGKLIVGADSGGANNMSMQLAELVLCNADIGAAGRTIFDAYVAAEYGL